MRSYCEFGQKVGEALGFLMFLAGVLLLLMATFGMLDQTEGDIHADDLAYHLGLDDDLK